MNYYRLLDDVNVPNRWFLGSLNIVNEKKISVWKFVSPLKVTGIENESIEISIRQEGIELDFTFADFELIIVNAKVCEILKDEQCQIIPVSIRGKKISDKYFIVILLSCIDCLDERISVFKKFEENDPIRPDKAGDYSVINKLYVDSNKVNGQADIFRLKKADSRIIVSERIKKLFESSKISGVKFELVSEAP